MALAPLTAVVLAGGAPDAVSALAPGVPNKSFVPVAGVALVQRTLAALRASTRVGRIVVVAPLGPATQAALAGADQIRPSGATMARSLRAGLLGLDPSELVLVCASDLPVLRPAAIDAFIALAEANGADLSYGCVERKAHLAAFPDVPHTWARFADGTFCGGGFVVLRPRTFVRLEGLLGRLGRARKNPLRLAAIFGWRTLVRYALGTLSIAAAERRASELLGASVRAAPCAPELAVNVDRPSDVALAKRLLTGGHPHP